MVLCWLSQIPVPSTNGGCFSLLCVSEWMQILWDVQPLVEYRLHCVPGNLCLSRNEAFAIHWVLHCCHMWPEEKKLLLSSESLWYAWGAVSCGLLNMITWIDVISYFLKPEEWSGEMKPAASLGEKRLWKQKVLGLGSVQLCRCGTLRVKSGGHRSVGDRGVTGQRWGASWGCRWVSPECPDCSKASF